MPTTLETAPAPPPPPRAAEPATTLDLLGVRIRFLVTAVQTGGAWSLLEYTAPAGFAGPAPHLHTRTAETFHVLEGTLALEVDGTPVHLAAGGLAHVPVGAVHRFSNPAPAPCRFLVHLTPGGMEGYFRELAELVGGAPSWPLPDMTPVAALGARFDSLSPPAPPG